MEIGGVFTAQVFERLKVVRHPPENLVLLETFCDGNLDGPVKGKFAFMYLVEDFNRLTHRIVAA